MTTRTCMYCQVGCKYQGSDESVQNHEENVSYHLNVALIQCEKQRFELEKMKTQLIAIEKENLHLKELHNQSEEKCKVLESALEADRKKEFITESEQPLENPGGFQHTGFSMEEFEGLKNENCKRIANFEREHSEKVEKLNEMMEAKETRLYTQLDERLKRVCSKTEIEGMLDEIMKKWTDEFDREKVKLLAINQLNFIKLDSQIEEYKKISKASNETVARCLQSFYDSAVKEVIFIWKVERFYNLLTNAKSGKKVELYSEPFFTHQFGYKLGLKIYPNGTRSGVNTHLSLFLHVMKNDYDDILTWPFSHKFKLLLLDQTGENKDCERSFNPADGGKSLQKPVNETNVGCGWNQFISHEELLKSKRYLQGDVLYFKAIVYFINSVSEIK